MAVDLTKIRCFHCGATEDDAIITVQWKSAGGDFVVDKAHDGLIYFCTNLTACSQRISKKENKISSL